MKYKAEAVNSISYVAGILAIGAAVISMVLFFLSAIGMIYPRKEAIVIGTESYAKVYDGDPLDGGEPEIVYGELHRGHKISMRATAAFTDVGVYENAPSYIIVDEFGDDVSDMYDIKTQYGTLTIEGRVITVYSESKVKQYDGTPLVSDPIYTFSESLMDGHTFVCEGNTSITQPGETDILPTYRILDRDGVDVTRQYTVNEQLGTLTVHKRVIGLSTESSEKTYDGTPLSYDRWKHTTGTLMPGHSLGGQCITAQTEVGYVDNEIHAWVHDASGNDMSEYYEFDIKCGTLTVQPIILTVRTGSASKEYDGKPIDSQTWNLTEGKLMSGDSLKIAAYSQRKHAGSQDNELLFTVIDASGADVTRRYDIRQSYGTLSITPRAITISTGSASKVYDGTSLRCEEYSIIRGSLCDGESIDLSFTSIVNVGYTQNYVVDYSITGKNPDGTNLDVTGNYRLSYSYGVLTVTSK